MDTAAQPTAMAAHIDTRGSRVPGRAKTPTAASTSTVIPGKLID